MDYDKIKHFAGYKMVRKAYDFVFYKNQQKYLTKIKSNNKNKDFTIICNNCIGGFIYRNLGIKYFSPTIWLYIQEDEFVKFVKDIKYYISCQLIELDTDKKYPVGQLQPNDTDHIPIKIDFVHYKSFDEAKAKWHERCKRINWNNIFYVMEFYHTKFNYNVLYEFDNLEVNKITITHKQYKNIKNQYVADYYKNDTPINKIFQNDGITGKLFLDRWNYVDFLNN